MDDGREQEEKATTSIVGVIVVAESARGWLGMVAGQRRGEEGNEEGNSIKEK